MGRRFTRIPQETFEDLQVETGILLTNFDPETGSFDDSDILTATTGGITVNVKPTFTDYGEDVDNCPNNTKELKIVDEVDVNVQTTALNINGANIKFMLAAADVDQNGKITVRKGMLKATDFKDIWFVGDISNGGFVAVHILNALSTDGFSLKTGKKSKGNVGLTLTGHFSINDPEVVPVEFYIGVPAENSITLSKTALDLTVGDVVVLDVTYSDPALIEDTIINLTDDNAPVKGAFTVDKKQVIVTANNVEGTAELVVYNGGVQAHCECTVTAAESNDNDGEG